MVDENKLADEFERLLMPGVTCHQALYWVATTNNIAVEAVKVAVFGKSKPEPIPELHFD